MTRVLTVSDSGPGIDPEFLPRIFDRFTQEDSSPTRTAGGLGVGLSLVRELVELHGGEIRGAQPRRRHGAMFTARFPLQRRSGRSQGDAGAAARRSRRRRRSTACACWCSIRMPTAASCCAPCCSSAAPSVRTAASVADALESLEAWRPDVLVSDSVSPEHDSYALVGKVQSLEADRGGRIPAAALTAWSRGRSNACAACSSRCSRPAEAGRAGGAHRGDRRLTGRERRRVARSS